MAEAVVIGASAGGLEALTKILSGLPASFPLPVLIVQHIAENSDSYFVRHLGRSSALPVKEAEDKEPLKPGTAYLAPPGYHLLVEPGRCLSLSVDPPVNHSRPAIDVLFESAADVFGGALVGVILTGANAVGSLGLKAVQAGGGLAVVQDPGTAESGWMPRAALNAVPSATVVKLEQIAPLLVRAARLPHGEAHGT